MKSTLLALVVLFGSLLTYGQDAPKVPAPVPPPATAPATPAPKQPIIEAGGLDARCSSGFGGHYNVNDDGSFGTNNPEESANMVSASTCVAYIAGWAHTLSGAIIIRGDELWFVEIDGSLFNPVTVAADLHKFLQANPEAGKMMSPLVLLKVALDEGAAAVTPVDIKSAPSQGPAPSISDSKSTT